MTILPLKTKFKGPAPTQGDQSQPDIIDEALMFFKANCFFRNYEVKGNADRVLIYLTLYIQQALAKIIGKDRGGAEKELYQLAIANFSIPGDGSFPLGGFVTNPANRAEADTVRQYFLQMRQELNARLVLRVYAQGDAQPSKWWICFASGKRRFLNMSLA
jgi:actin related protein 2/3 complex, subunit 3